MLTVNLNPVSAQQVTVNIGSVSYSIRLVQRSTGLFMDLSQGESSLFKSVVCLNKNKMVRYKHLGFPGDLIFCDTKGNEDPSFDGLGERFKLFYATEEELESVS